MSKRKCLLHANILKIDNPKHYFSKNKELYIIFFLSQDSCIKNVPSFTALLKKGFGDLDKSTSDLVIWALDTPRFKLHSCPKMKVSKIFL